MCWFWVNVADLSLKVEFLLVILRAQRKYQPQNRFIAASLSAIYFIFFVFFLYLETL